MARGIASAARIERTLRNRTYTQWIGEVEREAVRRGRQVAYGEMTVLAWEAGEDPAEFVHHYELHREGA
jgi:hypothetical protein